MNRAEKPLPENPISAFLSELRTDNTIMTYRAGIYSFLDWKFKTQFNLPGIRAGRKATPEEMTQYEALAYQYLTSGENYADDVRKFAASMQGIPPKTAGSRMTGLREFLIQYRIEFTEWEKRQIKSRIPRGGTRTAKGEFTIEVIRKIVTHLPIHGKTLVYSLGSSGTRIGELLQCVPADIPALVALMRDPDARITGPVELNIRQEVAKNGIARVTFISTEALDELREWMKVRDDYLKGAQDRNAGLVAAGYGAKKKRDDPRIFPFTKRVAHDMWVRALEGSGLDQKDPSTGRYLYHFHSLRSFFRTQMALAVPLDAVEAMMGHEGYLTSAYRNYARSQLAEQYAKGEPYVTIHIPEDLRDFRGKVETRFEAQAEILEDVVRKNIKLEKDVAELKELAGVYADLAREREKK